MLHSTDPKKLNKKERPSEEASISFSREKIVKRGKRRKETLLSGEHEGNEEFSMRCEEKQRRWLDDHENDPLGHAYATSI